ncbi:AF4/FMR2 family member lilli isoform X2 [Drosophila montana]|uniref:AF4/FMR2 family member lilli isoform X2 n=1 Tax=Drosophila montana TaxID=40370 RepID=UPI00313D0477
MQLSADVMATSSGSNLDAAATRCDLNGNATTTTATTKASASPRKEKTILGWLVKSASASDKANNNDNDNDRHNDINNQGGNNNSNNNSCHCETRAFRDFRGVQTLRLLWSKRISSASAEAAAAQQQREQVQGQGLGTLRKLNKSVSCLVNAFNNARDWPSLTNAHETRAKRAASLHNLQEPPVTSPQLQRDKDNFYKYKNAEQAKMQNKLRRGSDVTANASATFPAVKAGGAAGERLQWPKREDIVSKRKTERERSLSDNEHENATDCERKGEQVNLISAGREQPAAAAAAGTAAIRISFSATSFDGGSSESLQTVNSINSNTTTSTATTVTSRAAGTRRKYSFKTHAGKSFHQHHTPRRMSSHSHSHSHSQAAESSHASGSGSASGVVRQLTQQFNEIIQKDARLLEQVKRKNGVWLARGAHVYKIVEKPAVQQAQQQSEQQAEQSARSSMVQRNIKKFEKLEKPAVPLKPQQLLRKHQEQMNQRPSTLSLSKQMRSKRARSQQQQQREQQKEQELTVVREELAKTPPELHASTDEGVQSDVDVDDATKPKLAESALTQMLPVDELDDAEGADSEAEERQKQRKHKYATIYEKLRFLPFAKGGKKSASPSPIKTAAAATAAAEQQDPEPMPSPCVEADAKILAALEVLDQKLKILAEPAKTADGELLLAVNDDFEQRLLPNSSFIYQAANKQISNNQLLLNQAVNVTLVNAIEGEQMIMEQKQLAADEVQQQLEQQSRRELQAEPEEPMYEPITPTMESKTEPQASSLFKLTSQTVKEPDTLQLPVDDIYQTVEEATAAAAATPAAPTANANWLEGYESIAGSMRNSNSDDYEAFAPPATPTTTTTTLSTGTLGRNTRDELPELPKPKRVLPKSPLILRPAPAKPVQPSRLAAGKACAGPASTDEDDENIYDTIKGCYESLAMQRSQNANLPSTDAISLSSNCYESISNYRKSKNSVAIGVGVVAGVGGVAGATASGVQLSSSGSTLTLASDHRTNSLYESSLAAGVLYGSASVGCRSSLASSGAGSAGSGGGGGIGGAGKQCDKRSSIAGSSDNSDAWVDISDGEANAAAAATSESQFVVVRERFKQHRVRSPDWSKRIRDKRLQQNKAKSCIEDSAQTAHSAEYRFFPRL